MAYNIQLVVDCRDPHAQADWWAQTLGWVVEPSDEALIRSLVAKGFARQEDTMVHNGVLVWKAGAGICPPAEAGQPQRHRILFQPVPEPKTVKNRLHLDIRLGGQDKDRVRAQLEERGAVFLYRASQGPSSWYTMADPEGNEFCID